MYSDTFEHAEATSESSHNNGGFSSSKREAYDVDGKVKGNGAKEYEWPVEEELGERNSNELYEIDDFQELERRDPDQMKGSNRIEDEEHESEIRSTTHWGETREGEQTHEESDEEEYDEAITAKRKKYSSKKIAEGLIVAIEQGSTRSHTHAHLVPAALGLMELGSEGPRKEFARHILREKHAEETKTQNLYNSAAQVIKGVGEANEAASAAQRELRESMLREARMEVAQTNESKRQRYADLKVKIIRGKKQEFEAEKAAEIQRLEQQIGEHKNNIASSIKTVEGVMEARKKGKRILDDLLRSVQRAAAVYNETERDRGREGVGFEGAKVSAALKLTPGDYCIHAPYVTTGMQTAYQNTSRYTKETGKVIANFEQYIVEQKAALQQKDIEITLRRQSVFREQDVEFPQEPKMEDVDRTAEAMVRQRIRDMDAAETLLQNTATSAQIYEFRNMNIIQDSVAGQGSEEGYDSDPFDVAAALDDLEQEVSRITSSQDNYTPNPASKPAWETKAQQKWSDGKSIADAPLLLGQLNTTPMQPTIQSAWQAPRQSQPLRIQPESIVQLDKYDYAMYIQDQQSLTARISTVAKREGRVSVREQEVEQAKEQMKRDHEKDRRQLDEDTKKAKDQLERWSDRLQEFEADLRTREEKLEDRAKELTRRERQATLTTREANTLMEQAKAVREAAQEVARTGDSQTRSGGPKPTSKHFPGTQFWEQVEQNSSYWEADEDGENQSGQEEPVLPYAICEELEKHQAGIMRAGLEYLLDEDMEVRTQEKRRKDFGNHTEVGKLHQQNCSMIRRHLVIEPNRNNTRTDTLCQTIQLLQGQVNDMAKNTEVRAGERRMWAERGKLLEEVMDIVDTMMALRERAERRSTEQALLTEQGSDSFPTTDEMEKWDQIEQLLNNGDELDHKNIGNPNMPVIRLGELTARLAATLREIDSAETRLAHAHVIQDAICAQILGEQWTKRLNYLLPKQKRKRPVAGDEPRAKDEQHSDKEDDPDGDGGGWTKQGAHSRPKRPKPAEQTTSSNSQMTMQPVGTQGTPRGKQSTTTTTGAEPVKGYYAVKVGRVPGIYRNWEACNEQVYRHSGATFAKFSSKAEAESYYYGDRSAEPKLTQSIIARVQTATDPGSQPKHNEDDLSSISTKSSDGRNRCSTPPTIHKNPAGTPERYGGRSILGDEEEQRSQFGSSYAQTKIAQTKFDPRKFASKAYHIMIATLAEEEYTDVRDQITSEIANKFETWWKQYEPGMTTEKVRVAEKINQINIPWANATSSMVSGHPDQCVLAPGTTDKVDMLRVAKIITFQMDSRNIPPKQVYSILQLAQFLPGEAAQIVTREIQQEEKGGIWDIAKDTSIHDIVYWVVEIKKLLVRYVELIGDAVNEAVGMHTIATWVMKATTVKEIIAEAMGMIDMQLQIGNVVPDVLLCHILLAMDVGTPQSKAFSEEVKREAEMNAHFNRQNKSGAKAGGTKSIVDMITRVQNKYVTNQRKLPEVEVKVEPKTEPKKGVRPSNQIQTAAGAAPGTMSTERCPTCNLAAHGKFEQYGCLYYDLGRKDWKPKNIARGVKQMRKDVWGELEKHCPMYQALNASAKTDLKRRVEEFMPQVPEYRPKPENGYQKTPDGIATVVAGTSGSISIVNYVTGQAEDNLIILKALSVSGSRQHEGKPVLAQYDPGSVVTIGEKAWLEQLGARFEARPQNLIVGFNGVIKGAGTRWITHDAIITLKFDMEEVARYDEKTGDPITSGVKAPVWVILKCGVVDGLGLPLLLGGDAIKSMGLRTYDMLPVATIDRRYMMGTLSLEQAQVEAQMTGDKFWGATIEEETRQVHRATLVAGSDRRVTIPPYEARMIRLDGCTELLPSDISTVRISCKSENRLKKDAISVEGGIHEGVPQIIVVNKGTEAITLHRGAIKATVIPKKMRTQYMFEPKTPEAIAEMKKVILSHQVRVQNREMGSPIAAIPEALWHLMATGAKDKVISNYSSFSITRQLEMLTELLTKADIFESEELVTVEWLAMVDEELGKGTWKVFDPGTEVPPEVRREYMQAVESLNQRIKEGKYKTQRNVLLAQLVAVPNVIYHPDPDNPRLAKGEICRLQLTDQIPITCRPRRYTWVQKAFMTAKTTIMLKQGKLEIGEGDYTSALVLVPYEERIKASLEKWGDGAEEKAKDSKNFTEVATWYRMTSDFRDLNAKTIAEAFPLPRIDDLLDCVRLGTKVYTSGDIADAFFCIELEKDSRKYTGFRTHDQQFQYKVMPQGGKNCASRFSRIVAKVFKSIDEKDALKYMDDVLVHSENFNKHLETLWEVYQCLIEHELTFKLSKLHLGYEKIKFLGHILTKNGRLPDSESAEAIDKLAYPCESQEAVRQFLGMTVYYKDYIPGYSDLAMPLYTLTRSKIDVKEEWGKNPKLYEDSVDALKMALISKPCLRPPDSTRKFRVVVDACRRGRGLGAVLQQEYEDGWHPVAYWSKSLSKTEREYSPTELECKAMHDVILKFDVYLRHKEFEVITDHNALVYMVKAQTQQNNGRLMRYLMDMQPYDFTVTYRKGEAHMDADGVSRLLRQGEVPEYLTADDVETDKGPVSEEEIEAAKELAAKKLRYIVHIIEAKQRKALERNDEMLKKVIVNQVVTTTHQQQEQPETATIASNEVRQIISLCCTATTRSLRPRSQQKPNYTGQNKEPRPRRSAKNSEGGGTKKVRFSTVNEVANYEDEKEANKVAETIKKAVVKERAEKQRSSNERSHEEKIADLQQKVKERHLDQKAYRGCNREKATMNMEKYAFDNVIQSPNLAEELQYLVGKHYIDDENGREYEITGIVYDKHHKRVIGFRKDTSGLSPTAFDQNTAYEVFGEMGLLQLADLFNVDNYEKEVRWPGNDLGKIQEYQMEDPELKETIEQVRLANEQGNEYKHMDEVYKMTGSPEILVKEGNVATERWVWQVVIPEKLKKACMQIIHDGMGHPGASRCIATTRLKYTWKSMRKDITNHISDCRQCQLRKAYMCKPAVPVMQYPECSAPMERVHMDLTGPLPTSDHGNKYILVVKDYKTKFVWVYAIKDKLAITINAIITEDLIPTFGPMRQLITDRGTEFKNSLLKETCRLLKVERVSTTPSNPRANGCVEKHNNTLKDMLSMYVKENQKDWDRHMRTVTMLYNSTVNTATGYTPYYLMFGREMNMVDDVLLQHPGEKNKGSYEQQSEELVEALTFAWEVTTQREYQNYRSKNQQLERRKRIIEYFSELDGADSEEYRKKLNDLRNSYRVYEFREYIVGDWFYRKRHPVRAFKNDGEKELFKVTMKLQPRYDGPYQITGKINAVLYSAVIEGREIRVHAVNMKPSSNNKKVLECLSYKHGGRKRGRKSNVEENQPCDPKSDRPGESLIGGTTGKETLNPNYCKLDTAGGSNQHMNDSNDLREEEIRMDGEEVIQEAGDSKSDMMKLYDPEG